MEILKIQNIFRIPSFTICFFFLFFNIFDIFFFLFYLSMVLKKKLKFLCCFIVLIRDFLKKFCKKYGFFFKKKLRYLKSKISTKFHRLLFRFHFFSIFGILFSILRIQTCPKIMEFFVVFYCKS